MFLSLSQQRPITSHQLAPHNLYRRSAGLYESIVEVLERKTVAHLATIVLAQLKNLELAQRVHQVSRIAGAAFGFHLADDRLLLAFLNKELLRLLRRHALRVHPDADDVTAITQQGIDQLSETILRVVIVQAFIEHHLFAVMRPAFGVRTGSGQLSHFRQFRIVLYPEELCVMTGPDLMN